MRWQQLFADLSAQFDAAEAAADSAELASRTRAEVGSVRMADRVRAAVGSPVALRCRGAGRVEGRLVEVGVDWLLLEDGQEREVLVAWGAVQSVQGLGGSTAAPERTGVVYARLDLRWALRAAARDRSTVQLLLDDGSAMTGTLDRVGADHVELAEHALGEPRRAAAVRGVQTVALTAVSVVRTAASALG